MSFIPVARAGVMTVVKLVIKMSPSGPLPGFSTPDRIQVGTSVTSRSASSMYAWYEETWVLVLINRKDYSACEYKINHGVPLL